MADKLGVGVIGVGFGRKIHIPGFQEHPRTKMVAVASAHPAHAKEAAESYDIPFSTGDYRELIAHPDVNVVTIASPPFMHAEMALAAIDAGKPVLVEKPLAGSLAQAEKICSHAAAAQVPGVVDFELRFVPAWMLMKRSLDSGYIGRPRFISATWLLDTRADPDGRPLDWASQRETGGGILGALGSHVFDYLEWFFGEIREATGFLTTAVRKRRLADSDSYGEVTADDTFGAHLRFASGVIAAVEVCAVGWHSFGHRILAYGDEGTLMLRQESPSDYIHGATLYGGRAGDSTLEEIPVPDDLVLEREYPDGRLAPFIQVIDALVRGIDGQPRPEDPTLERGLRSQLIMDAVSRAHAHGAWIATGAGPG